MPDGDRFILVFRPHRWFSVTAGCHDRGARTARVRDSRIEPAGRGLQSTLVASR